MDKRLIEHATQRQVEFLEAIEKHGTSTKAAKALGVSESTIRNGLHRVKKKAAAAGYAPEHGMIRPVPAGLHVKGTSTLTKNEFGEPQWVKTDKDKEEQWAAFKEVLDEWSESWGGQGKGYSPKTPKTETSDILTVYPMGDPHIGMYAWKAEAGDNFDLKIAEAQLCAAMDKLVYLAPSSDEGMVVSVGDLAHADTQLNRTLRSGHQLDVDTRWSNVFRVILNTQRWQINRALEKHKVVHWFGCMGNHDEHVTKAVSIALGLHYENNPRVIVHPSDDPFLYHRFGKCLFGINHGEYTKGANLALIMAVDNPEDWGETLFRHWYTGHLHHKREHDHHTVSVETLRTLAGPDAHTRRAGFRSLRGMQCDVWHKDFGFQHRNYVGIEWVKAHLGESCS